MLSNTRPGVDPRGQSQEDKEDNNEKSKDDKEGGAKGAPTIIKDNMFSETKFKEWYQTNLRQLAIKN